MDIQEAREAFERRQAKALNMPYEGLKAHFDENSRLFGARYNAGSINEKEWNLWLESWQAAKAQAVPDGFVLVPNSLLKDINSIAINEFHKWKIKKEQMPEICEYMQDLSFYIGVEK